MEIHIWLEAGRNTDPDERSNNILQNEWRRSREANATYAPTFLAKSFVRSAGGFS
jgi:hypothetical protein